MVRVGVIGYGYWGPNLVRNLVETRLSTVVGVADLDQDRLDNVRRCYPHIVTLTDYRRLFDMGVDAIVVATPPATHFRLAKESIERGAHVMVEKPLTLDSREAQELVELAEQRDRVLMAGHTFVYNPAVRALKEIIDSGELGDIYYIDAVRASLGLFQRDLNVMWDLAPHDITILQYLLGADPQRISARGIGCVQRGVEDVVYLMLTFPGGVLAHVRLSWLDPCKTRKITVVGSKKMVVYDDVESLEKIKIYDKGVEKPPYTDTFGDFQFAYHYGSITIPSIRFTEPLRLQCDHFLECVATRTKPQSDGRSGMRVVQIIEAAQKSLRNGGLLEPIPEEVKRVERVMV